ncbi:MAG: DUF6596 domain-containing protein [Ilumatobacteraceae bacterium]
MHELGTLVDERAVMDTLDRVYRSERAAMLATLVRLLGDLELAEDGLQDALAVAAERWPADGIPRNPTSWLVSTGRNRSIDRIRRRSRFLRAVQRLAGEVAVTAAGGEMTDTDPRFDDLIGLLFRCCHPTLRVDAQVALALRELCGLTTDEIARAQLTTTATVAQRIVRAKRILRELEAPFAIPEPDQLAGRVEVVLHVVYLVFSEGYTRTVGDDVVEVGLTSEAIRLGRLLVDAVADPEPMGLLSLMLFHDARRAARLVDGDLVLLASQDRSLWDQDMISEADDLLQRAYEAGVVGVYTVQAAIAREYAIATATDATDWARIVSLYDILLEVEPNPVVALNRAVALAERDGPRAGLEAIDQFAHDRRLARSHRLHAARGELLFRLGQRSDAAGAVRQALEQVTNTAERRHLLNRLDVFTR